MGNLPNVNTFHVSAKDLDIATDIVLKLPGFLAAVNESIKRGAALPTTSVIINVLYDVDYTGHGPDPNRTSPSNRTLARVVDLTGLGMSGLFAEPVRPCSAEGDGRACGCALIAAGLQLDCELGHCRDRGSLSMRLW